MSRHAQKLLLKVRFKTLSSNVAVLQKVFPHSWCRCR